MTHCSLDSSSSSPIPSARAPLLVCGNLHLHPVCLVASTFCQQSLPELNFIIIVDGGGAESPSFLTPSLTQFPRSGVRRTISVLLFSTFRFQCLFQIQAIKCRCHQTNHHSFIIGHRMLEFCFRCLAFRCTECRFNFLIRFPLCNSCMLHLLSTKTISLYR